jgi:hypothetical protein
MLNEPLMLFVYLEISIAKSISLVGLIFKRASFGTGTLYYIIKSSVLLCRRTKIDSRILGNTNNLLNNVKQESVCIETSLVSSLESICVEG